MKTLILMRHAKSDWSTGGTDHARPLNARGKQSARAMGEWLRQAGFLPDQALVSDAFRTQQTWELLDLPIAADIQPLLYHASAARILELLQQSSGDTVLILAHNPDIAETAQRLIGEPPADPDFECYPTGATTILQFDAANWVDIAPATGTLLAFQVPRRLVTG